MWMSVCECVCVYICHLPPAIGIQVHMQSFSCTDWACCLNEEQLITSSPRRTQQDHTAQCTPLVNKVDWGEGNEAAEHQSTERERSEGRKMCGFKNECRKRGTRGRKRVERWRGFIDVGKMTGRWLINQEPKHDREKLKRKNKRRLFSRQGDRSNKHKKPNERGKKRKKKKELKWQRDHRKLL